MYMVIRAPLTDTVFGLLERDDGVGVALEKTS